MTTLILSALPEELQALQAELSNPAVDSWAGRPILRGNLFGQPSVLALSGVGKTLAAATTQYLCSLIQPKRIIFTGLAGALDDKLQIGDLLVATDTIQHDLDASALGFARGEIPYAGIRILEADPHLLNRARRVEIAGVPIRFGRILTGDQFISSSDPERRRHLTHDLQGAAVEMEGAAVALVAHLNQIPWLVVRTISDRADGSALVDFSRFLTATTQHEVEFLQQLLLGNAE